MCVFAVLLTLGSLAAAPAGADDDIPVWSTRLSDRVLLVHAGEVYTDMTIAVAGKGGLAVIDTGIAPSITAEYRKRIETEFGRSDFRYVINTHSHYDHVNGNQVFREARFVGHELCLAIMRRRVEEDKAAFIAFHKARIPGWEQTLEALDPESDEAQGMRETIYTYSKMCEDLGRDFTLIPPDITFNDRMTLDLGGVTLRLIYFGAGRHGGDDILVHCVEEKLVFSGDVFWAGSMQLAYKPGGDLPRWLEAMDDVLADEHGVDRIVTTHNGIMSREQLTLFRDYAADLWGSLESARASGLDYRAVESELAYDRKFTYIEASGLAPKQLREEHETNLRFLWLTLLGSKSGTAEISGAIEASGLEAALRRYDEIKGAAEDEYYFDERELNYHGYSYLGRDKFREAAEIFRIYTQRFPDSWRAYDGFAVACKRLGDTKAAIENYRKSLQLNPENEIVKMMLEELEKENK